jgi:hypothetical protein
VPQACALLELLDNIRVCIEHPLAAEEVDGVEEMSRGTNGREHLEAVLLAGVEVVGAMSRRRVHHSGAGFESDVSAEDAQ